MKKYVGIWVDHRKAVVVSLDGEGESVFHVESGVEASFRVSGGSRSLSPYGPQDAVSEKRTMLKRRGHLRDYYRRIIDIIHEADRLLIVGPGEAKAELEKEIKKLKSLGGKIVGVLPADKMTERQIVARVKRQFLPGPPTR